MAVNPLNLAESLRPWRAAGITGFLAEPGGGESLLPNVRDRESGPAPEFSCESSLAASGAEAVRPGDCLLGNQDTAMMLPARANGLSRSAAPASSGEKPSGHGGGDAPPGDYAVRGGQKTGGPAEKAENPAAEPVWPEAWQVLLARTRPAPVVWTYAELGQDLTGNGDKERADCLRRIIASLQLPKGSSAFWPVCLAPFIGDAPFSAAPAREDSSRIASGAAFSGPDDFTNSDEVQFFHAGLQRLNPRVVIMLGALALSLSGLGISMRVPFTQQIHKGTLYVLLPGFSALLSKKALQERASVFLRSALSGLSLS